MARGEGLGEGITKRKRRTNKCKGIMKWEVGVDKEKLARKKGDVDPVDVFREGFAAVWRDVHIAKAEEKMYPVAALNDWVERYIRYKRVRCIVPYYHFATCKSKLLMGCVYRRRHGASTVAIYDENINNEQEFVETVMHETAHWVVDTHEGEFGDDYNNCCECNGSKGHQHDSNWRNMFNFLFPLS